MGTAAPGGVLRLWGGDSEGEDLPQEPPRLQKCKHKPWPQGAPAITRQVLWKEGEGLFIPWAVSHSIWDGGGVSRCNLGLVSGSPPGERGKGLSLSVPSFGGRGRKIQSKSQ